MISPESLTPAWIMAKKEEFRGNPVIIEKVIGALVLLQALKQADFDFIFKGGTALMLMIQEPRRFSIDVDIIVENKEQDIGSVLDGIVARTHFTSWREQRRDTTSSIKKRHFKLFYEPKTMMKGNLNYILLDIVFETDPYFETQETPVSHFLLAEEGEPVCVITPTLNAMLGDKLTAYGPETTGVPLTKPMEVMKQIYDISGIMDRLGSLEKVKENFIRIARRELIYREFTSENHQIVINDIIRASYNFCVHGRIDKNAFDAMRSGVSRLDDYIYGEKFKEAQAQIAVSKAAYIAKQVERGLSDIHRFDKPSADVKLMVIEDPNYNALNKLKKHNPEAFYYWYKILES
ncbi:nucleotidyl transferase AbiEii/AbiGii toxin family protein [Sinomicrobium sp. M5D2P9]